jgi:glycosyltransferase involved in cell wall biosynthesis
VLVHDWLTGMRGGEKVLQQMAALFPTAPIFTLLHVPGSVDRDLEARVIHTSFLQKAPWVRARYRYYLPLFPRAIESLRLPDCDLVLSSSHAVAKGVRKPPGALHVCYCHTPMRYVWDQRDAYFPEHRGLVAGLRRRQLDRIRRWDVSTAGRVDHYIANSTFVAERISTYYDRTARVVHPPVDTEFFTPDPAIDRQPFCLYVSALAPYKRIDVAVEACRRLGLDLRVVGEGPERQRLESQGEASQGEASPGERDGGSSIRFLGRIEPAQLRDLYRRASCFVQPGVEDFGISAVEALACGCPVVALGRGGVLDIVEPGRHGVLYEGEGDAAALAGAIDKLRNMRFNSLDLRARAERFSGQRFRQQIAQFLAETYGTIS